MLADSPALDAGDNAYVEDSVDQRGYTRIVGSAVDIGAVEMQDGEFENYAPVATSADYSITHDAALVVAAENGLLTFATDADNSPLFIVTVNDIAIGSGMSFTTALGGTLVVLPNGTFEYFPPPATTGIDTFTYTVCDGFASSTATLTIHVTNSAPTVNNAEYTTQPNQPLYVPVGNGLVSFASDADGDILYIVAVNSLPLVEGAITVVGTSGGTLTVYADGSFEYFPAENNEQDDLFTFTLSDGLAECTANLTIHFGLILVG